MKKEIDCHECAHANAGLAGNSCNDEAACQTGLSQESEVSQKNSDRDISLCATHSAQYDKVAVIASEQNERGNLGNSSTNSMSCHKPSGSCNDEAVANSRNDSPTTAPKLAPKLAIVVPCYNEEAVVAHTYNALCQKLDSLIAQNLIAKESFLCFVDDGSRDKTCELLLSLKIPQHKLIKLTRNYGQQNALLAGLHFVKDKCDCAVSMDCDLQDDINALDEMLLKFKNGADIVYGVRKARDNDTAFKKYTALGFYKFMQIMGVKIPNNHAHYRLLSHRACENLLEFKEVNLFLRGIVPLVGYKSEVVYYERGARFAGDTKYSFISLFSLAWDAITSFSIAPLRLMSVLGVVLFFASICYGIYALYMKFFTAEPISGWTSTILVLLFFGGMQFLGLGIIGEYIGKIYSEVKQRPRYFVEEVL